MKDTIVNLVNTYTDFLLNVSEYTLLTEEIKSRMDANKILIHYYSLEKKVMDYSKFDNRIASYLLENKLDKFINKEIDNDKINELLQNGILNNDMITYFIEKEKTVLSIKSDSILNKVKAHKLDIRSKIKNIDTFNLIKKRELLRLQTNETRYSYFNAAKSTKDILLLNGKDKITVKVKGDLISLEIKVINRIYKNEFIDYLVANNIDAFKYSILDAKLKNSKDKRLDIDIVNSYKIIKNKECLFIKTLPGLLKKYNKKK